MLDYLQANTQGIKYLVAVPSSMQGTGFVLATGRPVLYMGGFNGQDNVIDAAGLAKLVTNHELRYVLWGDTLGGPGSGQTASKSEITNWLSANCTVVSAYSSNNAGNTFGGPGGGTTLYQ